MTVFALVLPENFIFFLVTSPLTFEWLFLVPGLIYKQQETLILSFYNDNTLHIFMFPPRVFG